MNNEIPEREYKRILKFMPRPCADIIVMKESKILLLHRTIDPGKETWALPGGRIKMGETTEETAVRKVKEETGLDISLIDLKLVGVFTGFNKVRQDICITYLVKINDHNNIKLDYQHDSYCWVEANKLPSLMLPFVENQIKLVFGNTIC